MPRVVPALALTSALALAGGCVVTIDASTSATASSGGPQTTTGEATTGEASSAAAATTEGSGSMSDTATTTTDTTATTHATTTAAATTDVTTSGSTAETTSGGACSCAADEFCDWAADGCGALAGDIGACEPRPDGCDDDYDPICGCDGVVHSNPCYAQAAGADLDPGGACEPPEGLVNCGYRYCDPALTYCQIATSDVFPEPTIYTCVPLPAACGDPPSCACLADQPCFEFGCDEGGPLLEILCPGG